MSGLSKTDLAVVLYLQVESKIENYTKKELILLIGGREFPYDTFEDYVIYNIDPPDLLKFDEESLKGFLQMRYKRTFPFALSLFMGQKAILRKTILWWFHRFTDFDPNNISLPSLDILNPLQRSLVENINNAIQVRPRKTLLQIVNAGPGTGKTTAANALAYELREEGVLLVSYTNESIKENYKRFFDYPNVKSTVGLKKYCNNPINLITVDSLAARIIGDSSDKNFDETIQIASIQIDPLKFVHPTRVRTYNHVIVDECQDIDDLRGNFLLSFCQKIGIKSLTLCGDPRQKIRSNCGKWYSDLWESTFDFEKNGHLEVKFGPIFRIGFETSYRFERQPILDLVNSISSARPGLHVELSSPNITVSSSDNSEDSSNDNDSSIIKNIKYPIQIITLNRLDKVLDRLLDKNETACIIGPCIEADNKTTNTGRKIAALFRAHGKTLSFRTEGAFQPDSIPFLTIHSVKGREFDTVFIFGMNNYPANFPMIPLEEAMSLIFVAHTRAKRRIFYIDGSEDGKFFLPLKIEPKFVDSNVYEGWIQESSQDFEKLNSKRMRHHYVTVLVEDHSFTRFLEANRYTVRLNEEHYRFPDWKIADKPKELSSEAWGFLVGFDYQCQLTSYTYMFDNYFKDVMNNNYIILPEDNIISETLEGMIVNNKRVKDGKLVLSRCIEKEDITLIKKASGKYSPSTVIWAYSKIYKNDISICREDLLNIFPDEVYLISSPMLTDAIGGGKAEVIVEDKDHRVLHGKCDYTDSSDNVYEFKYSSHTAKEYKTLLQVWLYHVMIGESEASAYILDCQRGILREVISDESIYRWQYILRNYFILRHHIDLVTSRRNYFLSYGKKDQRSRIENTVLQDNSFCIDTEFFGKDIFEIALVNVTDPYKTLVELIRPSNLEGMLFALEWLPGTQVEMYKSTIDRFKVKFGVITSKCKETLKLGYYIASTDVDWYKKPDALKIDLGRSSRKATEDKGCFLSGSHGPKLGELYTLLAPFPLEYQSHLSAHTALADSLMLYELIVLGLIEMPKL